MPYVPEAAGDEGRSGQSGSSQNGSNSVAGPAGSRHQPKGIARYFKPQPRGTQPQVSPAPATAPSSGVHLTWRPSTGPPRPLSNPSAPSTPTLVRRPSTIQVVIDSSPKPKPSQSTSRDASEDSIEALKVTSDLNPQRHAGPTTPLPSVTASTTMEPSSKTPRPRGRPPKNSSSTPRPKPPATAPHASTTAAATIPATPTEAPATAQPAKRRGRPVGWRPGMGSYAAINTPGGVPRTAATKTSRSGQPKKRGRPPGRPPGRPGVKPTRLIFEKLRPKYVPFLCEWDGCPAELQNVDTLRRHILVVHGQDGVQQGCRWGKCNTNSNSNSGSAALEQQKKFKSDGEFEQHVEDSHLTPFVWFLGDGPRNTVMEYKVRTPDDAADDLPGYLFDSEGNQVTPSVLQQEFENEEDRKARRRRLRRVLEQRDRNAPEEEEMDVDEPEPQVVEGSE